VRVELRPSVPSDFVALNGTLPPLRVRSLTAVLGSEVLGVGALVMLPDGSVWASTVMREDARRFSFAIHRAGVALMRFAREAGYPRVYACANPAIAGRVRWLEALGFRQIDRQLSSARALAAFGLLGDKDEVFEWVPR
jgi:hypothetical protein